MWPSCDLPGRGGVRATTPCHLQLVLAVESHTNGGNFARLTLSFSTLCGGGCETRSSEHAYSLCGQVRSLAVQVWNMARYGIWPGREYGQVGDMDR